MLHLMAIAQEAGAALTLEDFDRVSRRVPFLCNLQPCGKYPIVSLDASGGISAVLKTIEPRLFTDVLTVTGKTMKELLFPVQVTPDDVLKPLNAPQRPEGGIAVLRGNLAPNGAVVKLSGVLKEARFFTGLAFVFDSMEAADGRSYSAGHSDGRSL